MQLREKNNKGEGNVSKEKGLLDKEPEGFDPVIEDTDENEVEKGKDKSGGYVKLKKGFARRDRTLDDANLRRNSYYGLPPDFGPSYGNADCECGFSYITAKSERPFCPKCGSQKVIIKTAQIEPVVSGTVKVCGTCGSKQYTIAHCTQCGIQLEETMNTYKKLGIVKGDSIAFTINHKLMNGVVSSVDLKNDKAEITAGSRKIVVAGVHVIKKVKAAEMGIKDVDETDIKGEGEDEDIKINLEDGDESTAFDEEINDNQKSEPPNKDSIDDQLNEHNEDSSTENLNVKAGDAEGPDEGVNKPEINDQLNNEEELTSEDIKDLATDEDKEKEDESEGCIKGNDDEEDEEDKETTSADDDDKDVTINVEDDDKDKEAESDDEQYDFAKDDDDGQKDYDTNENEQDLSSAPAEGGDSDEDVIINVEDEDEDKDEDAEGCMQSDDEEKAPELVMPLAPEKLEEENVSSDRIAAHLFNLNTENPQWNISVDGTPIAAICLEDQPKPEEVSALFVTEEYGNIIRSAVEEQGLKNVLQSVRARFFVNEIDKRTLAKRMQAKAEAGLKHIYQDKILGMVNDFADALRIAMAGYNKNAWDHPHILKAGLFKKFKDLGITNPMPYIEEAWAEFSDTFFDHAINKAIEIMAKTPEAKEEIRTMVSAAKHTYVRADGEEIPDDEEETESSVHSQLVEGNFPILTNQLPKKSSKIPLHFGRGLGAFDR